MSGGIDAGKGGSAGDGCVGGAGAEVRAGVMFWVSVAFLAATALVLPHGEGSDDICAGLVRNRGFVAALLGGWLLIVCEGIEGVFRAPDSRGAALRRLLLVTCLPVTRMAWATCHPNGVVWLPWRGWAPVRRENAERAEIAFALPMLGVTLLVLPVLGAEIYLRAATQEWPVARWSLHLLTAFIWFAFALEFVLMVGLVPDKVAYIRRYWINLVIIVLPLVAFLRLLMAVRFLRLLRAGQLLRAYRLRGLYARAVRLATVFNLVERLQQRNPRKYLATLEDRIARKEEELRELNEMLCRTRERVASLERGGVAGDAVAADPGRRV